MSERTWFCSKKYGYGWTPCCWEGWLILATYFFLVAWGGWLFTILVGSSNIFLLFYLPYVILLSINLAGVAYFTGEKPRWRWGDETPEDLKEVKK